MAKRFTATAEFRCWKHHTCSSCSAVFSYILERKVVGTGPTADKANANLQTRIQAVTCDENDMHPCPACGHYQQDMIGLRLGRRRNWLLLASCVMPVLLPILLASYAVQANTLTWIAAFYCAAALVAHLLVGRANPNRDCEANRHLAADRMAQGLLYLQPATGAANLIAPAPLRRPSQSIGQLVALILLAASLALALLPEVSRSISGAPLNAECYPPVVGPNDSTRVYMPDSITSIKGFWRGNPTVTMLGDDGNVAAHFQADTNSNDWGSTIYAKSSEKTSTAHPWVQFTVPNLPDLEGKTITCHLKLDLDYPQVVAGGGSFNVVHAQMQRDVTLTLARAGAGGRYNGTWWSATVAALLLVVVAGVVLRLVARNYRRQAHPTQISAVQPAA